MLKSIAPYTRFVKSTKLLLGLFVFILTSLMFLYPIIKKDSGLRIAFTSTEKSQTSPTKMINANFHGFDESNQPYNLNAKTALQIDENNLSFEDINSDISLNNGVWLTMQANKGSLLVKEKLLDLVGAVEILNDNGYELKTDKLHIDIGKKIATTDDIVNGQGILGTLKAKGAIFDGNTKISKFGGRVFVKVYLPAKELKDE
ncbi:MAG: LPS export ABC transporter periplasmic protein LptC [Pseudomonadota bacterium]